MVCSQCGALNEDSANFVVLVDFKLPVIGTKLELEPVAPKSTLCDCGAIIEGDIKFCGGCGAKTNRMAVPVIPVLERKEFCGKCGKKTDPESKFCGGCGTATGAKKADVNASPSIPKSSSQANVLSQSNPVGQSFIGNRYPMGATNLPSMTTQTVPNNPAVQQIIDSRYAMGANSSPSMPKSSSQANSISHTNQMVQPTDNRYTAYPVQPLINPIQQYGGSAQPIAVLNNPNSSVAIPSNYQTTANTIAMQNTAQPQNIPPFPPQSQNVVGLADRLNRAPLAHNYQPSNQQPGIDMTDSTQSVIQNTQYIYQSKPEQGIQQLYSTQPPANQSAYLGLMETNSINRTDSPVYPNQKQVSNIQQQRIGTPDQGQRQPPIPALSYQNELMLQSNNQPPIQNQTVNASLQETTAMNIPQQQKFPPSTRNELISVPNQDNIEFFPPGSTFDNLGTTRAPSPLPGANYVVVQSDTAVQNVNNGEYLFDPHTGKRIEKPRANQANPAYPDNTLNTEFLPATTQPPSNVPPPNISPAPNQDPVASNTANPNIIYGSQTQRNKVAATWNTISSEIQTEYGAAPRSIGNVLNQTPEYNPPNNPANYDPELQTKYLLQPDPRSPIPQANTLNGYGYMPVGVDLPDGSVQNTPDLKKEAPIPDTAQYGYMPVPYTSPTMTNQQLQTPSGQSQIQPSNQNMYNGIKQPISTGIYTPPIQQGYDPGAFSQPAQPQVQDIGILLPRDAQNGQQALSQNLSQENPNQVNQQIGQQGITQNNQQDNKVPSQRLLPDGQYDDLQPGKKFMVNVNPNDSKAKDYEISKVVQHGNNIEVQLKKAKKTAPSEGESQSITPPMKPMPAKQFAPAPQKPQDRKFHFYIGIAVTLFFPIISTFFISCIKTPKTPYSRSYKMLGAAIVYLIEGGGAFIYCFLILSCSMPNHSNYIFGYNNPLYVTASSNYNNCISSFYIAVSIGVIVSFFSLVGFTSSIYFAVKAKKALATVESLE
ncbi:hypothetical protein HDV06_000760 [Boothiomyces sp. JEL0866]|nr:hypothetical protein HDV06_000760 [Boothiomyces sp. JEL0866]